MDPSIAAALVAFPRRRCITCGKRFELIKPQECASCQSARYCSRDCQKENWPHHKPHCRILTAAKPILRSQEHEARRHFMSYMGDWQYPLIVWGMFACNPARRASDYLMGNL
jgi:hypothetical protein